MADLETLERALRNADAAGDTEAAQTFASEIRNLQSGQGQATPKQKPKGFLDEHPGLRTALQIGTPLVGTIAGAAAMAPFTGGMSVPAAAASILAGEGVGSLLGESINQATGVSEPSATQQGLALAGPGIGKSIAGIVGNIPRLLPGYGEALRAAFTEDIRSLPKALLGGGQSAEALYKTVASKTGTQRMTQFPELSGAIKKLGADLDNIPFDKLKQDLRGEGLEDLFEQIAGTLKGTGPKMAMASPTVSGKAGANLKTGLPKQAVQVAPARDPGLTFDELKAATEGFGRIISKTSDPVVRGNYQQLYKGILKDVEKMPAMPGVPVKEWNLAREATKRKYAEVALTEATEKAIKTRDGIDIVDPNQVVKWLRNSDEIKSRVSGPEYRKILNEYRYLSATVGHNLGHLLTGLAGASIGGVQGATASVVGFEMLSRGMMTEPGRRAIHAWASNQTQHNLRKLGTLLGAGSAAMMPRGGNDEEE